MLRKIVIDYQRVFSLMHEIFADGGRGIRAMYLNDAGDDAGAETTIVYSIAPASSSLAIIFATFDSFCPIAT